MGKRFKIKVLAKRTWEVVRLAFPNPNFETIAYTVTYSGGPKQNPNGSMTKGDSVSVTNKMNFNVTETNRS